MFTIDRHGRTVDLPFAVHAVRYDPKTGKVLSDSDDDHRGFAAVYSTKSEIGRDAKNWAFELEPGHYAISSIDRVGVASQPVFTGGSLVAVLIATAVATAASHAIAAAEHESLDFVEDDHVGPQTPTFTVAAGRVTHIGNFTFGKESRIVQKPVAAKNSWSGPNVTSEDATRLEPVAEIRTLVDYSFDRTAADPYLRLRRLDRYPVDHRPLQPLVGRRLVLVDFPGETVENRTPLEAAPSPGSIPSFTALATPTTTRPAGYASSGPVPAAASGPVPASVPADGRASLSELQERFLSGKISKAEYERERARLAAGS